MLDRSRLVTCVGGALVAALLAAVVFASSAGPASAARAPVAATDGPAVAPAQGIEGPTAAPAREIEVAGAEPRSALWRDGSGRIHLAWMSGDDWRPSDETAELGIARFLADGTLDPTYATGGVRRLTVSAVGMGQCAAPAVVSPSALSFAADGQLNVLWGWSAVPACSEGQYLLDRYTLDGSRVARAELSGPATMVSPDGRAMVSWAPLGETWSIEPGGPSFDLPATRVFPWNQAPGGPLYLSTVPFRTDVAGSGGPHTVRRIVGNEVTVLPAGPACGSGDGGGSVRVVDAQVLPEMGGGGALARMCATTDDRLTVSYLSGGATWSRSLAGTRAWIGPHPTPGWVTGGRASVLVATCEVCPAGASVIEMGPTGAIDVVAVPTPFPGVPGASALPEAAIPLGDGRVAVAWNQGFIESPSVVAFDIVGDAPAVPGAPTNVRATAPGQGRASVSWTAPAPVAGAPVLRYEMRATVEGVDQPVRDGGTDTTEVVTGLSPGPVHRFRVRAVSSNGAGPWSAASNPVTPPRPPYPTHPATVDRLVRELWGRAPTTAERSAWASRLESGELSPGRLAVELRRGTDHLQRVDPIVRLYQAYFLRRPDAAGLDYWVAQRRGGRTLQSVSEYFRRSGEFIARYGTLTNRQFVELIYRNILGRPGEPAGVAYWTGELDSGRRSRGVVMLGFSESPEYRAAQSSEVDVSVLYIMLLRRTPTAAEYAADVALLDGAGTAAGLADRLTSSAAYAART